MKLRKVRGKNRWTCGSEIGERWFSARAELISDGRYDVSYRMSNGYGEGVNGSFVASSLPEAEAKLDSFVENSINTIQYRTYPVKKGEWSEFFDRDGDIFCPNCTGYGWKHVDGGKYRCTDCGCCYDPAEGEVFYDLWDHGLFNSYRENTEAERSRMFAKKQWLVAEGGYAYYPENYDSGRYNLLTNYEDPKDRSKILNFDLRSRIKGRFGR